MFNRPLLFLNRFDIKQLCQFWNLSIFPDKTNKKLKFRRNRIRKQLLPLLRFFFNRQIDQILYQFSEITLTDKFYLDYLSVRLINQQYKDFQLNQKFNCVPKPSASGRQYSFRLNPVWNSKFKKQNKRSALEPSELLWQSTLARSSSISDRVEAPPLDLFVSIDLLQRRFMPCIEVFNAKSIRPLRELVFSSSLDFLLINLGNFKNNMNGQKKLYPLSEGREAQFQQPIAKQFHQNFGFLQNLIKICMFKKNLIEGISLREI
uniref:tRNA(Ile)-lysidine synthetase n=2 Tax=Ignatiaceae TaxID=2682551 RepID=A0A1W6EH72_9CHLO|nr:hypothetical chloroplast RF62 [Pseudocharacium americanum]YP_009367699.1 tRNA(Ile)-lysidine synthetase [Ignatius tetrasporus]ARK14631.1 hypothetical chloroplast RF62 [Pseudocharacium americanum]ARK14713.1 tRNA(Ile)-lysidine synthetase [Ignatius tetrasporus]